MTSTKTFGQWFPRTLLHPAVCALLLFTALTHGAGVFQKVATQQAEAAPLKGYEALQVTSSGTGQITMNPGETRTVTMGFQNTGTANWVREGEGFVSIYTHEPKYRSSIFKDSTWFQSLQPTKITEALVKPGQVGTIQFILRAPAQPGTYSESFQLAAEDKAWIPGGKFTLTIQVGNGTGATVSTQPSTSTTTPSETGDTSGLGAVLLLRSAKTLEAKGGERLSYTIGVKNAGSKAWSKREVRIPQVSAAFDSAETADSSWVSKASLLTKQDGTVGPGSLDFLTFQFRAPKEAGNYTVRYVMAVDGVTIPEFAIDIPVNVTTSAPDAYQSPVTESYNPKIAEPMMRIGVLIVDDETDWKVDVSCASDWNLVDGTGATLYSAKAGKSVVALYDDEAGAYYYNTGEGKKKSASYLRFVPTEKNAICTVNNFDRRVTRGFSNADNTFRNVLELRYNKPKDRTWLINELPMEMYLRGLGETSNVSHEEFQKALITIARTYALYHFERGTKYKDEFFHITSYSWDQVYNGYGQEQRAPRLTESVKATAGRVVTYEGKTAITPYFSRSDGRTRDWSEVWYGSVPWIKSVPTPCDKGKTLWGHGVGLSASEALCQANQGKKWDEILHYFYQGVDLDRWW